YGPSRGAQLRPVLAGGGHAGRPSGPNPRWPTWLAHHLARLAVPADRAHRGRPRPSGHPLQAMWVTISGFSPEPGGLRGTSGKTRPSLRKLGAKATELRLRT